MGPLQVAYAHQHSVCEAAHLSVCLSVCRYAQLLNAVSELRAKIYHLSCVDPIPASNPLSIHPFKTLKDLQPGVWCVCGVCVVCCV